MKKISVLLFLFFFGITMLSAQGLLNQDLRQIHVDQLSDADLQLYYNKLQQAGISLDQALQMAAAKGMRATEIQKLKQRLTLLSGKTSATTPNTNNKLPNNNNITDTTNVVDSSKLFKPLIDPKIFGAELFNSSSLTFEPNTRLATPLNYEVGPDDELEISVYGVQETNFSLPVSAEGAVTIPNVGQVKVAGLSMEEAMQRIKIAMQKAASGVKPPALFKRSLTRSSLFCNT